MNCRGGDSNVCEVTSLDKLPKEFLKADKTKSCLAQLDTQGIIYMDMNYCNHLFIVGSDRVSMHDRENK